MQDDEEQAWWLAYTLIDQVLGEVSEIALISELQLIERPGESAPADKPTVLSELRQTLQDMGFRLWDNARDYLDNSYISYELKPVEDPDADWRLDVYTGSSRLPVLINEYMSAGSDMEDEYRKDGIAAGFLCYPLDGFGGGNRAEQILQFRDTLQESIQEHAESDTVTFLGGATGLYCGYLDFLAWDLSAVLDAAREFFAETDLLWGGFHVFHRDVGAIRLWEQEKEPEVDPETGSLLSGKDIEALDYAEKGIREEPDYPWIWLQAGKLRSHFGNKAGALEAVARGLALEPGDYEFLTLKKEIEDDAALEQMGYHWLNPDADQILQQGLDEAADDKYRAISCMTVNPEGLEEFWTVFDPKPEPYTPAAPFIQFPYMIKERPVDLVFQMNEGGLSKLNMDWMKQLKNRLQDGQWLERVHPDGRSACLDTVLVGLDYHLGLLYKLTKAEEYFQISLNPDGTEVEDSFWSSGESSEPELYTKEEMNAVEQYIQRTFGEFGYVFHELVSPDIHVDICVIPPSEKRNYYTLVTMGMGAHQMNVPDELAEYHLERAELAVSLPPDWKLDEESMKNEQWYWPIGLLKALARLPITSDTWLGWGQPWISKHPLQRTQNSALRF